MLIPDSRKILIIDDSIDMRDLLSLLLESKGYEVKCSTNGEDGLKLLNSDASLPALILLDLRMPIMDGLDFLELKKQSPRLRPIPVIMMTAEDDLSAIWNQHDIHRVLSKPFSLESVFTAVASRPFLQ